MSLRAIGSLLTRRRFSTPRTAPARSLHSSLRDLAHGRRRAAAVAAVAFAGVGAVALQYFKKGTGHDESMESRPPCDCDKHLRMMWCPEGIDQTECDNLFMEFFAMYEKEPREELDKLGPDDIAKSIMAIYEKRRATGMEASREAVPPRATQDSS